MPFSELVEQNLTDKHHRTHLISRSLRNDLLCTNAIWFISISRKPMNCKLMLLEDEVF